MSLAIDCADLEFWPLTHLMQQGSFLPLMRDPFFHFSFLTASNLVLTRSLPAWVFLISHQGASVSMRIRSIGRDFTTAKFSGVRSELQKINCCQDEEKTKQVLAQSWRKSFPHMNCILVISKDKQTTRKTQVSCRKKKAKKLCYKTKTESNSSDGSNRRGKTFRARGIIQVWQTVKQRRKKQQKYLKNVEDFGL